MGLFEHFPYTDFHRLNLDWILKFTKNVKDKLDDIDAAVLAAINAQHAAEDAEATAEQAATDAVSAKNEAVDAKTAAVNAKNDAVDAKNAAANSQAVAHQSALDAINAKDAAVNAKDAAVNAKNDAVDAKTAAVNAKNDAADSAATAADGEAWAVGTKNGTPVPNTAPQYNNYAKYWAQQAQLAPMANVYANSHEYFDSKTLGFTGWGYRYAEADDDCIVCVSVSMEETGSEEAGDTLAVSIAKMINGVAVEYAVSIEDSISDPNRPASVETSAFIKLAAGEKLRFGCFRHTYNTGTPVMTADANLLSIGGTLTIDANYA